MAGRSVVRSSFATTAAAWAALLLFLFLTSITVDATSRRYPPHDAAASPNRRRNAILKATSTVLLPTTTDGAVTVARGGAVAVVASPNKMKQATVSTSSTLPPSFDPTTVQAVSGAVLMAALEQVVKAMLKKQNIAFPAPLASCLLLLVFLLLLEPIQPALANGIHQYLTPGAALLAKWLPVFFVPGLAMLPLAPSVGGPVEVVKVIAVAIVGFLYTLFTTVTAVMALRTAQGTLVVQRPTTTAGGGRKGGKSATPSTTPAPSKPFSDATLGRLLQASALLGGTSLLLTTFASDSKIVSPDVVHLLKTGFFAASTVAGYVWAARLPTAFTTIVHPLVVASVVTLALLAAWGSLTSQSFTTILKTYKVGNLQWNRIGAGDLLLYLLGPAVVSFSLSMYGRRQLLKQNWMVVTLAMLVSSAGGLYGTAGFVRLINLGATSNDGGRLVRLSVLARNVTTALAIALTSMLGGDMSICASVVVLTGIVGATYGKSLLTSLGIVDPVARGLAIGSSSQGLGVASLGNEPDAFPFAAMGMVLTAIAATTLVSIPAVKAGIIRVATGST